MEKLRIGVIGAGRISAGSHLPCLTKFADVELVLCEVDEGRLRTVADRFGIRETRSDYRDMLTRDRPDAIRSASHLSQSGRRQSIPLNAAQNVPGDFSLEAWSHARAPSRTPTAVASMPSFRARSNASISTSGSRLKNRWRTTRSYFRSGWTADRS